MLLSDCRMKILISAKFQIPPAEVYSLKWTRSLSFSEFLVGLFVSIVTASCELLWVSCCSAVQEEIQWIYMYEKYIVVCRLHFCRWNPSPVHNQACFVAVSECTVADSVSSSRLELEIMTWAVKQSKMGQGREKRTPGKCGRGQNHMKNWNKMERKQHLYKTFFLV